MNLEHAQFFASRCTDMADIIKPQLTPPKGFTMNGLDGIRFEGSQVIVTWSHFSNCDGCLYETDYYQLADFFKD